MTLYPQAVFACQRFIAFLILTIAIPALATEATFEKSQHAQAFAADLFKAPLLENWKIRSYSWTVSRKDFDRLTKDESALREFIAARLHHLAKEVEAFDEKACLKAATELRKARPFVDRYPASFHGKYALALWFTKFDQDNWFSFEQILKPIEKYLDGSQGELVVLKQVKPIVAPLFRTKGLFDQDLPIVLSRKERSVTIFAVELFD